MKLRRIAQIVFSLWIVAMVLVWTIFRNEPQCVDANRFIHNAIANWNNGTLYPSRIDLYQDYITAIGYTNLLQLAHLLFGQLGWMQLVNMAMNIGIVLEIFYIARRLFSPATGYVAVVLYCLMTTNLFSFLQLVTEIPFLFITLSAFTICLKASQLNGNKRFLSIILLCLSGILFAFAHTIRAVEMAFIIPGICFLVFQEVENAHSRKSALKRNFINIAALLIPYAFVLIATGLFYKSQTGIYVNRPMTGWHNFIKIADDNDPITTSNPTIYSPGRYAYIPNWDKYTFEERDSIYRDMSIDWLKKHPAKFLSVYGIRILLFWSADYFYIPNLTSYDDINIVRTRPDASRAMIIRRLIEIGYSAIYYIAFVLFIIGIISEIRKRHQVSRIQHLYNPASIGRITLLLIIILGTAGSCLFPIEIRFHYPYTWAMTILAADAFLKIKKSNSIVA